MQSVAADLCLEPIKPMSLTPNKIKGIEDLTEDNYSSWSKQVTGALKIIYFDPHLQDKYYEDYTVGPEINKINRRCILEFLFSRMDEDNSNQFRAGILDVEIAKIQEMIEPTKEELEADPDAQARPGKMVPEMDHGPAHLWTIVRDFHQANNKANIYLIQAKIEKFKQDYKISISTHIDNFLKLKNEFLNRGGNFGKSYLGRRLLHSLHSSQMPEVRKILRKVKPITSQAVIAALKQYEDKNSESDFTSGHKLSKGISNLNMANNTFRKDPDKPKCTATKCVGPHPTSKCFKRMENAKAQREWFESRDLNLLKNHKNLARPSEPAKEEPTSTPVVELLL
ncbi:hypothetical protein PTTG_25997 [Puccinia triticina 1-1 BBBD Race 1]|uniref:Uncharacterized protein n=1 Tax=Puccinia triticina (isolate 1-1 / race 1 (BBBD)) TaxID=630390 RepID=A0A180GXK6_PUCT1|nr:hypothetical protein PTTG_25997 [Puccinia triticina 1-1 BBBD Race 1]